MGTQLLRLQADGWHVDLRHNATMLPGQWLCSLMWRRYGWLARSAWGQAATAPEAVACAVAQITPPVAGAQRLAKLTPHDAALDAE